MKQSGLYPIPVWYRYDNGDCHWVCRCGGRPDNVEPNKGLPAQRSCRGACLICLCVPVLAMTGGDEDANLDPLVSCDDEL